MTISFEDISLRDMAADDIEDVIRWNMLETEWMDWDAPWEKDEPFDAEKYRRRMLEYLEKPKDENRVRSGFQIYHKDRHIGWVSSYNIDDNYNFAKEGRLAIGIDICEGGNWGKGLGGKTFSAFVNYLFSHGYDELYTQTWSGNERMIRMAERLGFAVCHRKTGIREVRGKAYDGLTLRLSAAAENKTKLCVRLEKYADCHKTALVPMITDFWLGFGNKSTDDGSRETITEWSRDEHYFYAIILNGEPVGFIHSGKYGSVKWINELYVIPAFRGRGIAKRSIAMFEEILRNDGAEAVCMDVVAANADTLRLYHGLGFDRISLVTLRKDFERPEYCRTEQFGGLEFNIRKPIEA